MNTRFQLEMLLLLAPLTILQGCYHPTFAPDPSDSDLTEQNIESETSQEARIGLDFSASATTQTTDTSTDSNDESTSSSSGNDSEGSTTSDITCSENLLLCDDMCVQPLTDEENCGECGHACTAANASTSCVMGTCQIEDCEEGWYDFDQDPLNGCEVQALRVFVSSEVYSGNLGGIAGADEKCQALALDANLGGNWQAWLAIKKTNFSEISPSNQFTPSSAKLIRLDGEIIAQSWSDLLDGDMEGDGSMIIQQPIDIDETGNMVMSSEVWTNVSTNGVATSETNDCQDWTSDSAMDMGNLGHTTKIDQGWTEDASISCEQMRHLYCFEVASEP